MKTLLLLVFYPAWTALPALSATPDFTVEMFSNRVPKALTLEATQQPVRICGVKTDGPCLVLPPGKNASCFADRLLRCHFQTTDRSFTFLAVNSATLIKITPTFAVGNEQPPAFLFRNARITPAGGGLQVTTRVDLESYVSAVLRGEASVLHEPAGRQAMAIIARTWAVRWQGRHRGCGFDFCSLTHCQVFRLPQGGEREAENGLDAAALATRGQVLQYHGQLTDPYFTASCGGMTEAAGNIWPNRAKPYLQPVHDPYCLASSHASWEQELSSESLHKVLRDALHLPLTMPLSELSVEKRDSSGRALVLRVAGGSAWNLDANEFRYAVDRRLGWTQIKSNLYTVRRQRDSWIFSGHGLGHGVGLCQAGAENMARRGASPQIILSTYFPGTEIAAQTVVDSDPVASSEHFTLIYVSSQEPWVKQSLDALERWRKELGEHAQVLPLRVRVQTWATVEDFVRATGEPGWVAASSDGQSIALEPLALLARKHILIQTLRHELTHLVVHRMRSQGVPRWFEEGLVLYVTGEKIDAPSAVHAGVRDLEEAISHPQSEDQMKAAYAQALERVRQLERTKGEAALWRVLEHPSDSDRRWLGE